MILSKSIKRRGRWTKLALNEAYPLICVEMDNVHSTSIIYKHSMYITIGQPCDYDQCITMRMMYPSGVCLCEDNFFKLSPGTLHWALVHLMYMCEGALCTSFADLSRAFRLSPATCGLPKIVKTFLILSRLHCHGHSLVVATWGSLFKKSLKCPTVINHSISSLKVLHFIVLCPMSL